MTHQRLVFPTLTLAATAVVMALSLHATAEEKVVAENPDKTRVGTCTDAKEQSKYWCEERAKVTVVSFGMECENAKKNVIEACEGVKSEDQPYKFDNTTSKKE